MITQGVTGQVIEGSLWLIRAGFRPEAEGSR